MYFEEKLSPEYRKCLAPSRRSEPFVICCAFPIGKNFTIFVADIIFYLCDFISIIIVIIIIYVVVSQTPAMHRHENLYRNHIFFRINTQFSISVLNMHIYNIDLIAYEPPARAYPFVLSFVRSFGCATH